MSRKGMTQEEWDDMFEESINEWERHIARQNELQYEQKTRINKFIETQKAKSNLQKVDPFYSLTTDYLTQIFDKCTYLDLNQDVTDRWIEFRVEINKSNLRLICRPSIDSVESAWIEIGFQVTQEIYSKTKTFNFSLNDKLHIDLKHLINREILLSYCKELTLCIEYKNFITSKSKNRKRVKRDLRTDSQIEIQNKGYANFPNNLDELISREEEEENSEDLPF